MFIIYGSEKCPDCINCKANFDTYKIEYQFVEVLESLQNLKHFLHYRDNRKDVFDRLIKLGDIGLPAIVDEDDNVFTDWESYLIKQGFEPFYVSKEFCSINNRNC